MIWSFTPVLLCHKGRIVTVFCAASPPLPKSFKTFGEKRLFLSQWWSWICYGERGWECEEKQTLEVFFLPVLIPVLRGACLNETIYQMADNWHDTWYYIKNTVRIPVWVRFSSPWAGLLIQISFSMIQCVHLATINTTCLSVVSHLQKVGIPVEIYVCKKESAEVRTELQVSWRQPKMGIPEVGMGSFIFPCKTGYSCSVPHVWRQKNHCWTYFG